MPAVRPESAYEAVDGAPICVPFLKTLYPVTPDVVCPDTVGSIEAAHEIVAPVWVTFEETRPDGTAGGVTSAPEVAV